VSPLWLGIGRVIFWRYRRGSWQYDILCIVILLFIFLTPRSVFDGSQFEAAGESPPAQEAALEAGESDRPN
jgi:hypothetical protein